MQKLSKKFPHVVSSQGDNYVIPKFQRFVFQPLLPMGKNNTPITGSKAHWNLACQGAIEGTVLLKNDGTLPLSQNPKICLFGSGVAEFFFGGGGSGYVQTNKTVSLAEGLQDAADAGKIQLYQPVIDYYNQAAVAEYLAASEGRTQVEFTDWLLRRNVPLVDLPEDLYQSACAFGDTAIFCISRYSSEGEVTGDRTGGEGDFELWSNEKTLLDRLCQDFRQVVVVLNVCGPMTVKEFAENDRVGAVLYLTYGGGPAGEALTKILLGECYPSGHLQDTLAYTLEDYPSTATYKESSTYVNYTEDIFVGYRYFETFATNKVVYPFGYGLSYTTFQIKKESAVLEKNTVKLTISVKNTGSRPGKEVVQAYLEAPMGKLGKAKKVLCAFAKTRELNPGEVAQIKLHFDIREFGSFDDLGKICECAFILEQGTYRVHVGCNVRDTEEYFSFNLDQNVICRRCNRYMAPKALKERLTAFGTMEALPAAEKVNHKPKGYSLKKATADETLTLPMAYEQNRLDDFLASLPVEILADLLSGHIGTDSTSTYCIGNSLRFEWRERRIPLIPTADGPAGFRSAPGCGVYATYFPSACTVAQSWNLALAEKIGATAAREIKENNIGIWLAPALNIHRNPLCGRNFEYYSEDPLCSGLFATSVVKGVQSQNIAATVKHFCCNNKEHNRKCSDSRVSQRALREIYLRGFEIVIKKARPWCLMTSYNLINGEQSSTNWESINGILRGEWKYDGLVMTDWAAFSNINDEIHAGSDVKMPKMITTTYVNSPKTYDLAEEIRCGNIDLGAVVASARRILKMMEHLD